ncbi:MAG: hypothetical protein HDS11_02475 [Bacteroides sp.]|nr:hypothetical protein [Bacteroides sp.]
MIKDMYLKRAEPLLEERTLQDASLYLPNVRDFKVYRLLNEDGSPKFNTNGQIALKMFSDQEILNNINSGAIFSLTEI